MVVEPATSQLPVQCINIKYYIKQIISLGHDVSSSPVSKTTTQMLKDTVQIHHLRPQKRLLQELLDGCYVLALHLFAKRVSMCCLVTFVHQRLQHCSYKVELNTMHATGDFTKIHIKIPLKLTD